MAVTLHTDLGDLKIELFCDETPKTCENFLALCASHYYDGCMFHRNIKGFMIQTGDPSGMCKVMHNDFDSELRTKRDCFGVHSGTGKGGKSIWGKKFEDEIVAHLKHNARGVVSMANGGPNTNGSQFFIVYGRQPHLDMKYTVFGKLIDGFETLDEFEKIPTNEKNFRPFEELKLKSVTIHANPLAG